MKRRDILKVIGYSALGGSLPRITLAGTGSEARLVVVILRGAVDGLALAPPYGDHDYTPLRGELAFAAPGTETGSLRLDGMFGLNPALRHVHRSFLSGEATVVHAVASPYRDRSHFDGQDVLENGAAGIGSIRDGWLNRALAAFDSRLGNEKAIALAANTPLILRGSQSVTSWAPSRLPNTDDETLARLQRIYADDEFFAIRLQQALRSQEIAGVDPAMDSGGPRGNDQKQFADLMSSAARFLTTEDGPTIAVVELGGWDTHANQGTSSGTLANRLSALDAGLENLRQGLGDVWGKTVSIVVTEFGRTVRPNGTRGTDHGTGTAAILMGGAVNGGTVIADWPGLGRKDLYADRDLMPTTDIRSVFKGVLADHLALSPRFLETEVFPDSRQAPLARDLIKA